MSEPTGDTSFELYCAYCLLTTGGGTKTPAVIVVKGLSVCERHVREYADKMRPEVNPQ